MAQSGYTPIQLYRTTTVSATPTAGNLADGELAINTADGKLFYKDNGGVVRVIAQTSSVTNVASISFGSTGLTPNTATTGAVTVAGTLATTNGGTGLTSFTANRVFYSSSTSAIGQSANLTFDGTTLTAANFTDSSLTSGRVTYATTGGNLTDSANLTFDGSNLGVGATTVAARVDIVGSTDNQFRLSSNETNATTKEGKFLLRHYTNAQPNFLVMYPYSTSTDNAVFYGGGSSSQTAATFHAWMTAANNTTVSGTEQMRLTSTGLGIGTSSPAYKLDVTLANNNFILAREASANITNGFRIGGVNNEPKAVFSANSATGEVNLGAINTNYFLTFSTNGANERFRIASNGAWGLAGANYGTSGQVLTSNGSGSAPTWQNAGGGGSAATPTTLGTVYGKTDLGSPYSSFLGYQAGNSTTASSNVGVGYQSVYTNSTGTGNAALGVYSLYSNTTGNYNTAVGSGVQGSVFGPLHNNTTGSNNIAVGTGALYSNTTADNNTAVGYQALYSNTTGSVNTAVGYQALYSNTTGPFSTAVGYQALYTSNAFYPTAVGYQAARSNTSGDIVALGYQAAYSQTSGVSNTALGNSALYSNTSGTRNTAVGAGALYSNATSSANTAVGTQALQNNLTDNNTAVGYYAMQATTTGNENCAYGRDSLVSNTTGPQNVAIGNGALAVNTVSGYNTAVGYRAGYFTNTNGANTLIGYQAGYNITTGQQNTLIGYYNGNYVVQLTTGSFNIHLGTYLYSSSASVSNEIVVGYNVSGKGANTAFIGASSGAYQQNNSSSWSTTSDFRLKKNIVDNNEGLEKIAAIRVRNFEYRTEEEVTDFPAHMVVKKEGVQLGVIAQELQQVCPDCVKEESTGVLSVDSDNVFWHMVNAIKQLKTELDTVKAELATLKGN